MTQANGLQILMGKEEPVQLLSGANAWRNTEHWSPDGKILAFSAPDFPVRLYHTDDWSEIKEIDLGEDFRRSLSGGWSPNNQYLAMLSLIKS